MEAIKNTCLLFKCIWKKSKILGKIREFCQEQNVETMGRLCFYRRVSDKLLGGGRYLPSMCSVRGWEEAGEWGTPVLVLAGGGIPLFWSWPGVPLCCVLTRVPTSPGKGPGTRDWGTPPSEQTNFVRG